MNTAAILIASTSQQLAKDREREHRKLSIIRETYPSAKIDIYEEITGDVSCCCTGYSGRHYIKLTIYFYLPDTPQPWKRPKIPKIPQ